MNKLFGNNGPAQPAPAEVARSGVPPIEILQGGGKVRILDVVLDRLPLPNDPEARRFIPPWEEFEHAVCWDEPTLMVLRSLAIALQSNTSVPVRLEGPTGVSKSFGVEVLSALTNRPFLRHNYSKDSDVGDTIGRFVPSDGTLSMRIEELEVRSDIKPRTRAILEDAKRKSKGLTAEQWKDILDQQPNWQALFSAQWKWKNGTLTGSMMYGSIFSGDERNLAPGNVLERENSALERVRSLRIVEHDGEIIRPLTPSEQAIIRQGGIIPGVIGLSTNFWYVAAQNPYGIGGGRYEESEAARNRMRDVVVNELKMKDYTNFLRFLILGEQPDVVFKGRIFRGEKNVRTEFRALETIPNINQVIAAIAKIQEGLETLVKQGKIGGEKDLLGGSYVYTRRNLLRLLDTLIKPYMVDLDELFGITSRIVLNTNWHDRVMDAIREEYLVGMSDKDREQAEIVLAASGIAGYLGPGKNDHTTASNTSSWVQDARRSMNVAHNAQGGTTLSRTALEELARGRGLMHARSSVD